MNFNHIGSSAKDYLFTLVLLFLIVLLSNSCEFEPHKIYERTVNEDVSAPEIQVVELNLEYDTIFLYGSKRVRFKFKSTDQDILAVRFTIDDEEKFIVKSSEGVFDFGYGIAANGFHSLILEVYTESGSGSIAEHLAMEGFVFSKSWVLYIEENYYHNVQSTINDGFLRLYWNRYRGYDFRGYIIRRTGWNLDIEMERTRSAFFIDSSYVGEKARYDVDVLTTEGTKIPWGYIEFEKNLPELIYTASVNNEYVVKWNKCKYFGAVDSFRISFTTYKGINPDTKSISSLNDTTYMISKSYFGRNIDMTLRIVPKKSLLYVPDYYSLFESYLENFNLGYPFGSRDKIIFKIAQINRDEFLYLAGCDSINRYSVSQKRIVEQFGYQTMGCSMCNFTGFQVSPSGEYMTAYIGCDQNVMMTGSHDLVNYSYRNLEFLSGQDFHPVIELSDNGIMLVDSANAGLYVYNYNTNSILAYYNKKYFISEGLSISSNGDYIFLQDDSLRLVGYSSSKFRKIWCHSRYFMPEFFEFDGKNPDRLVIWNNQTFSVRKCNDFSLIYEFQLTEKMLVDIDYYNGIMLTWSPGHLYVRNLSDGSLLHDVIYRPDPGFWYNSCRLVGDAIICMQGVIYFLD